MAQPPPALRRWNSVPTNVTHVQQQQQQQRRRRRHHSSSSSSATSSSPSSDSGSGSDSSSATEGRTRTEVQQEEEEDQQHHPPRLLQDPDDRLLDDRSSLSSSSGSDGSILGASDRASNSGKVGHHHHHGGGSQQHHQQQRQQERDRGRRKLKARRRQRKKAALLAAGRSSSNNTSFSVAQQGIELGEQAPLVLFMRPHGRTDGFFYGAVAAGTAAEGDWPTRRRRSRSRRALTGSEAHAHGDGEDEAASFAHSSDSSSSSSYHSSSSRSNSSSSAGSMASFDSYVREQQLERRARRTARAATRARGGTSPARAGERSPKKTQSKRRAMFSAQGRSMTFSPGTRQPDRGSSYPSAPSLSTSKSLTVLHPPRPPSRSAQALAEKEATGAGATTGARSVPHRSVSIPAEIELASSGDKLASSGDNNSVGSAAGDATDTAGTPAVAISGAAAAGMSLPSRNPSWDQVTVEALASKLSPLTQLEDEPWLWFCSRSEAESMLARVSTANSFLVRPLSRPNTMAMTIFFVADKRSQHMLISYTDDGVFTVPDLCDDKFSSMAALLRAPQLADFAPCINNEWQAIKASASSVSSNEDATVASASPNLHLARRKSSSEASEPPAGTERQRVKRVRSRSLLEGMSETARDRSLSSDDECHKRAHRSYTGATSADGDNSSSTVPENSIDSLSSDVTSSRDSSTTLGNARVGDASAAASSRNKKTTHQPSASPSPKQKKLKKKKSDLRKSKKRSLRFSFLGSGGDSSGRSKSMFASMDSLPSSVGNSNLASDIRDAIRDGNLKFIKSLVRDKRPLTSELLTISLDLKAHTALHLAADSGHEHIVKYLLEREGVRINQRDSNRVTPLLAAAVAKHLSICELLLQAGADPTLTNDQGATVLHYAVRINPEITQFPRSNKSLRKLAKRSISEPALVESQKTKLDANAQFFVSKLDKFVRAVRLLPDTVNEDIIRVNRRIVTFVNHATKGGDTPLIEAARTGNAVSVKWLLDQGADWSVYNSHGMSPVTFAEASGNAATVALLVTAMGRELNTARASSEPRRSSLAPPIIFGGDLDEILDYERYRLQIEKIGLQPNELRWTVADIVERGCAVRGYGRTDRLHVVADSLAKLMAERAQDPRPLELTSTSLSILRPISLAATEHQAQLSGVPNIIAAVDQVLRSVGPLTEDIFDESNSELAVVRAHSVALRAELFGVGDVVSQHATLPASVALAVLRRFLSSIPPLFPLSMPTVILQLGKGLSAKSTGLRQKECLDVLRLMICGGADGEGQIFDGIPAAQYRLLKFILSWILDSVTLYSPLFLTLTEDMARLITPLPKTMQTEELATARSAIFRALVVHAALIWTAPHSPAERRRRGAIV